MRVRKKHTVFILVALFLLPQISSEVHFTFFHQYNKNKAEHTNIYTYCKYEHFELYVFDILKDNMKLGGFFYLFSIFTDIFTSEKEKRFVNYYYKRGPPYRLCHR